jgi:uncharacterized protein
MSEYAQMKPSEALYAHRDAIREVTQRNGVRNVRVFGSVVRGSDTHNSDLDLLVDPGPQTSLMDIATIQLELQAILGVKVDVSTPNSVSSVFRDEVLREALPI